MATPLFLTWKGAQNDQRIWWATSDGQRWSAQQRVPGVLTSDRPALTVDPRQETPTYMAWKGLDPDQGIYWATFNGQNWSASQQIPGIGSSNGPALAWGSGGSGSGQQGLLYMAWKGIDDGVGIYWATFDGQSWSTQQKVPHVGTSASPALSSI